MAFNISEEDYIDVEEKAKVLGLNVPTGIALLPRNFAEATTKEELLQESEASTVRILFRENGIVETPLELQGERLPEISEKFADLILPTLFFTGSLIIGDDKLLNIALGVIGNYLTDIFKGKTNSSKSVRFSLVVKKNKKGTYKKIEISGDVKGVVAGLKEVPAILKAAQDDTND